MSGLRSFLPLSGAHHFDLVFSQGSRVRRGGVTIVAVASGPGPARVGLVAGRRVGGAVVRNRAKRRLRAVLDQIGLADGFDYVVIASPGCATVAFATLERWVSDGVGEAVGKATEKAKRTNPTVASGPVDKEK